MDSFSYESSSFPLNNETQMDQMITSGEENLYDLLFSDEASLKNASSNQYDYFAPSTSAESKRRNLDESYAYLQNLNALHVERLQLEPALLHDQKQQIHEEIKNLAFSNYKTFIRTAQCSREIYSDFSIIDAKLDHLIGKLPEFSQVCDTFTKNIQNITTARRSNNLTLQKHNQLLEILEISQLMDTCVRNEYYDEALDLAHYVKRLDKKFSQSIPLIQQIVNDVNNSLNLMLKQLLQQLKTNLQFNQCLKIIGLIRRLDVFTESELRLKFLQLRDSWLQSLLQNIPNIDPYHHISKTIEEFRIHLFDIITQYRAIFSDDEVSASQASGYLGQQQQRDLMNNEAKLFYCWLQQKIKRFLSVLRKDLRLGVGSRMDSVLSQSMYFGLAFSRVGLDFRALMLPVFEEAISEQIQKSIDLANLKFEENLVKVNWSDLYLENIKAAQQINELNTDTAKKPSLIVNPPMSLLEFQPLAVYLNTVLHCFNELRLCAPIGLYERVKLIVEASLRKCATFLQVYFKRERANLDSSEVEIFESFVSEFAKVLVPFVEKCLGLLFPISQLQRVIGVGQTGSNKLKKSIRLRREIIFENLKELVKDITIIFDEKEEERESETIINGDKDENGEQDVIEESKSESENVENLDDSKEVKLESEQEDKQTEPQT